jgi:glyoxylase-like metal-dependent hydrolase (beta-lactamase superfamily II)
MKLDRRQFIALSSGALAVTPLARVLAQGTQGQAAAAAAPQAPPAVPKFENLRRNVGVFTMRGGTIGWLVNKDAAIVIDTQYPDTAQACVDGLKQKSGGRTFDAVFNTHHHADHTGGNAIFRANAKRIIAHKNVPELLRKVAAATPNAPAPTLPDSTFDKAWSEKIGGEAVTAWYYGPGHTGGDAMIHFERAHVVHMGDLLFHERHPRVDRPAGASIQNWIVILEKFPKDMPADTIYIAGHARDGAPVTVDRKAVLGFRDYLDAALTLTKKGIAAGQSKEAIASTAALPGFEHYQSSGTVLTLGGVLTAAYEELTGK